MIDEQAAYDIKKIIEKDKELFYSNPIHWANNKRRMMGLPVLRGNLNKSRNTIYSAKRIHKLIFDKVYDVLSEFLRKEIPQSYGAFVDVKEDLTIRDHNCYQPAYPIYPTYSTIPYYKGVIKYEEGN